MFKSFSKLINSDGGKIIISIILGIGLASLFKKACNDRNCLVFKSPALADIKDQVFQTGDKCVTFQERNIQCNTKSQQIDFE
tara:strand:+ start:87 stop:332 length:246 start_codon:yes stop_codon:yes gene_type:complete